MREKFIEKKLVDAVRKRGGLCPKLVSPGMNGMPDRLVLLPGGRIGFMEVKAPGKKPRPLQSRRLNQLLRLGFPVCVLDDPAEIPRLLRQLAGTHPPGDAPPDSELSASAEPAPDQSESGQTAAADQFGSAASGQTAARQENDSLYSVSCKSR